jgi:hypothetical protein
VAFPQLTWLRLAPDSEQREAELRAGGVDVEAEKAEAREAYEKAQRGEAPSLKRPSN